ncbi:MAG: ATP-binding protein [Desulfurivibrionaceae bacterium]|nr:ATP-binding protein [Desulfobulbales bacterium]MDT8335476.1 ATP-binding protein [Desulfurivibrionaceae bacterium]
MRKIIFVVLLLIVIGIGLLHFFTPGDLGVYHAAYRRFSYFPIVLGAIWFGLWGGVFFAVLSSLAFIPHLFLYLGDDPRIYLSELIEIVLYLAAGTLTGFIASREAKLRDKYRKLSEELEEAYERLHHESAVLLEVENQLGANQKLSALGELSASLAHEIKNPLSALKGTAEIILDEFPEGHPKREFGEIMVKEVDRLNATVNEILQYSKGQTAIGSDYPPEPLNEVVSRLARLLESHLRKKAVTLRIDACPEADRFMVDGSKMAQILLNIILNAIDALSANGRINLKIRPDSREMVIAVSDNGPGIPEEMRPDIFKPFVSGKEHGTGLGLSISAKIVESLGGRIDVGESDAGGACFSVTLPESG